MARSSHPSLPPASEHNLRPLNLGSGGGGGGERPLRAQLVIAAVLVMILVAVPLYLLRRPSGSPSTLADAGAARFGGVVRAQVDASTSVNQVLLGPIQRVKCGRSADQPSGEGGLCDALPTLEAAFRDSIRGSVDCAPRTGKEGNINYVLEVDFAQNRLNVFPGQSGNWRGPRARRAATCVLRSLPPVSWPELKHQHDYYAIAILATYPAPDPLDTLPTFE